MTSRQKADATDRSADQSAGCVRARGRRGRLAGLALGLFAAISHVPAIASQEAISLGDFSVSVESPWPGSIYYGYFPVFVDVRNESDATRRLDLDVRTAWAGGMPEMASSSALSLEPGERRVEELLVPAFRAGGNGSLTLNLQAGRDGRNVGLDQLSGGYSPTAFHIAFIGSRRYDAGLIERVRDRLQQEAGGSGGSSVAAPIRRGRVMSSSGSGQSHVAFELPLDRLPSRHEAWSSLDLVVLDARTEVPVTRDVRWAPLLSWVRLGGQLVVVGDDGRDALARLPGMKDAFEARFRIERPGRGEFWRYGFGRVLVLPTGSGFLDAEGDVAAVVRLLRDTQRAGGREGALVPGAAAGTERTAFLRIPGLGELPLNAFLAMLLLFAVVIGPVNLFVLKKIGRPGLLLLTIPAISLVASIGLLAYGILYQGVDVKAARRTLTVLDQRGAEAVTIERRALFVGLSPGSGLTPDRGTAVYPAIIDNAENERFVVTKGEGLRLTGSFLPVRAQCNHFITRKAPARARLQVTREGDSLKVTNGFDVELLALDVHDEAGEVYRADAALAPGETAVLRPTSSSDGGPRSRLVGAEPFYSRAVAPSSGYLAVLESNPFADSCGLDMNERAGCHAVVGVLPLSEADWGN